MQRSGIRAAPRVPLPLHPGYDAARLRTGVTPPHSALIVLAFTRDTGHAHPHLRTAFGNYRALLAVMDLDAAEQARRLAALGAEAGLDDAAYRQLLSDPGAGAAPGTASPRPAGARGGIRTVATALLRALGLRRPG